MVGNKGNCWREQGIMGNNKLWEGTELWERLGNCGKKELWERKENCKKKKKQL